MPTTEKSELNPHCETSVWTGFAPWAVGLTAAIGGYFSGGGVSDWNITHWLFTYDQEFTRRALVGTLLWSVFAPDPILVRWLGVGLLIICSATLTYFAVWCVRGRPTAWAAGFVVLAVACPATLTQFGYDCGRFDQLNMILFLTALVVILRGSVAASAVVALLAVTAQLVHEAFFIIHVPVLLAVMIHRSDGRVTRGPLLVGVVALILTALVVRFGSMETMDHETYESQVLAHHNLGEGSVHNSTAVLYTKLPQNLAGATGTLPRRMLNWRAAAVVTILVPWLCVALATLRSLHAKIEPVQRRGFWLLVIAAGSPLLLTVVGTDLFRWWALCMVNLIVVTLVLVRMHPTARIGFRPGWKSITLLVGFGLFAGPLGVNHPLPGGKYARVLVDDIVVPALARTFQWLEGRQ